MVQSEDHQVVADKKTLATLTYQLTSQHHLPDAQFVKNWSSQLRNDKPLYPGMSVSVL